MAFAVVLFSCSNENTVEPDTSVEITLDFSESRFDEAKLMFQDSEMLMNWDVIANPNDLESWKLYLSHRLTSNLIESGDLLEGKTEMLFNPVNNKYYVVEVGTTIEQANEGTQSSGRPIACGVAQCMEVCNSECTALLYYSHARARYFCLILCCNE